MKVIVASFVGLVAASANAAPQRKGTTTTRRMQGVNDSPSYFPTALPTSYIPTYTPTPANITEEGSNTVATTTVAAFANTTEAPTPTVDIFAFLENITTTEATEPAKTTTEATEPAKTTTEATEPADTTTTPATEPVVAGATSADLYNAGVVSSSVVCLGSVASLGLAMWANLN